MPGYEIVDMQWNVTAVPGGPSTILTGTAQAVVAQLIKLNPNWKTDFSFDKDLDTSSVAAAAANGFDPKLACDLYDADISSIEDGIAYLRLISGRPHLGPGPKQCSRVSCSWESGIFLCNEVSDLSSKNFCVLQFLYSGVLTISDQGSGNLDLDNFGIIADGAQLVHDGCVKKGQWWKWGKHTATSGKAFHDGDWNVVVSGSDC